MTRHLSKNNPRESIRIASKHRRLTDNRTGATAVEFAMVFPLAFLLFISFIEISRANLIRNTVKHAAYQSSRKAIVSGGSSTAALDEAKAVLDIAWISDATVTLTPGTITEDTEQVTVTISVPLGKNMWVTPSFLAETTVSHTCTLTREESYNAN